MITGSWIRLVSYTWACIGYDTRYFEFKMLVSGSFSPGSPKDKNMEDSLSMLFINKKSFEAFWLSSSTSSPVTQDDVVDGSDMGYIPDLRLLVLANPLNLFCSYGAVSSKPIMLL